jgi:hypothetical protein
VVAVSFVSKHCTVPSRHIDSLFFLQYSLLEMNKNC